MSKGNDNNWDMLDIALVLCATVLAANNADGWGWLLFILFIKNA